MSGADILQKVIDNWGKLSKDAQRKVGADIGADDALIQSWAEKGDQSFSNLRKEFENQSKATDSLGNDARKLNIQFVLLKRNFEAAGQSLFTAMLPYVKEIPPVLMKISDWISSHGPEIAKFFSDSAGEVNKVVDVVGGWQNALAILAAFVAGGWALKMLTGISRVAKGFGPIIAAMAAISAWDKLGGEEKDAKENGVSVGDNLINKKKQKEKERQQSGDTPSAKIIAWWEKLTGKLDSDNKYTAYGTIPHRDNAEPEQKAQSAKREPQKPSDSTQGRDSRAGSLLNSAVDALRDVKPDQVPAPGVVNYHSTEVVPNPLKEIKPDPAPVPSVVNYHSTEVRYDAPKDTLSAGDKNYDSDKISNSISEALKSLKPNQESSIVNHHSTEKIVSDGDIRGESRQAQNETNRLLFNILDGIKKVGSLLSDKEPPESNVQDQAGYLMREHPQLPAEAPKPTKAGAALLGWMQPKLDALEKAFNLPLGLLRSVATTESGGNPYAVSGAGAKGLFQFMDGTAKDMGLKGNDVFDPMKSAEAAAKYLSQLLRQNGGDLNKALASYNWGIGNVQRKGLENAPSETQAYVPKVLAGIKVGASANANVVNAQQQQPSNKTDIHIGEMTVQSNASSIKALGDDVHASTKRNGLVMAYSTGQ
ncbi:Membrane-bound lytic murein transglycosylase D precursor [Cedecea lapagei]|uniref:peptidoglycan lytic exotransglycosylase n=1 Tax=Cedecea lapagei TaxID=158823 RepID=A0A447V5X3_9ENTR|nr:lytic transglycosylase domain-containing protein [Cedecea lapagei]VEB99932.1 Membrane-bound lytic murein transglycosylase D precursor [Cedecea lapagei]